MLLNGDCLSNAVGKQPSIPLIDLGRKPMMMMMINGRLFLTFYFLYVEMVVNYEIVKI